MRHSLSTTVVGVREYVTTIYNVSDGPDEMDLGNAITRILDTELVHELKSADVRP